MLVNSFLFLKGGPFRNHLHLPCARLDSLWTLAHPGWTSGPFVSVLEPCLTIVGPWLILGLICGSFVGFCRPLVNSWLDHCWTVLDSWVISSLGFQLELFVSLLCTEGLEWVVSLEISAGFIGWKFGWLEIGKNGRFTRFKSP